MNVLVVNTNRYSKPMPVMPLGACIAAEAARAAGHEVAFLDLMFARNPERALAEALGRRRPEVVGFSIRNIDNNDAARPVVFTNAAARLAGVVRETSDARIVIGGGAVGIMPEALVAATGADWAVVGDGEKVFPELLSALSNGHDPEKVPGVAWPDDGTVRRNAGHASHGLDKCLVPDFSRWIDVKAYTSIMCSAPIQTKRGCPFRCHYCTYSLAEGTEYRLAPPESVAEGAARLAAGGVRDIEFVDNVFNSPYEHAMAICEAIASAGVKAQFETLELNPRFVDGELVGAMRKAGFNGIGISAESASDKVLAGLGKGFGGEDVRRAASAVNRGGIACVWMFLLGGPGETRETVRETIRFAEENVRGGNVAFFNVGIRIYPGTEIERIAREEGQLAAQAGGMLEPVFYFSRQVERRWVERELEDALSRNMNFVGPYSINVPYLPAIQRIGYRFGMRPPLWRYTRPMRRALRMMGSRA
jgi:radical SAM superfamily enzyme YgiQ (UPF0313 family)